MLTEWCRVGNNGGLDGQQAAKVLRVHDPRASLPVVWGVSAVP